MLVQQAYRFALAPTPAQARKLASHAGAARFAYNFGLALVKERLERRAAGQEVEVPWTLPALRREWNARKREVAPWWAENSKEAASCGLADLARGFKGFWDSKHGRRAGERVGFPRFKRRGRSRESFRYTTGSFGVCGRTRVQLPRVGRVRTHEPTAKLQRKLDGGQARILSATISREGGRWYCSFCCEVKRSDARPRCHATVGVDAGVRHLAVLSTGEQVANPRALQRAQRRLARLQRKLDRQRRANNRDCFDERGRAIPGRRPFRRSRRQQQTERRVSRLHAHAANVRRDAIHKLTSRLVSESGTIVVERLNARGLCRGGNRGLRRAIHDAAMAEIRRQLAYKTDWRGATLIEAPTFYPSSKTCSACGAAKAKLALSERTFRCERCGLILDRDENAARNLAALQNMVAGSGPETKNARSRSPQASRTENPCKTRPVRAVGRPRSRQPPQGRHQTGTVCEQSEAA
jgi:putative transposase